MKSTGNFRMVPGVLRLFWTAFLATFAARALAADAALPCPPQLRTAVHFWIRVYTQIDTNEGFLHDPNHLGVVYATVRFAPGSPPAQRQRIVDRERDHIAAQLRSIAAGVRPLTPEERRLRALWGAHPSPSLLREAAGEIRFQLGQSNRFKAGLIRSGAWQHAIARALAARGLPPQLAALPLVESSYNPRAYSKDGAAGLWQFMPGTAERFLRIDAALDQRFDPFSATVAAAQLLAYNYRILGTWPLAITAYNQGVAGMLRAVRVEGTRDLGIIVRRYHTAMFGFASRNFYASFLAALYVDEHAQRYFGALRRLPEEHFQELTLPGYVSVEAIERAANVGAARLRELNPGLRPPVWSGELDVPKGYRLRLPAGGVHWTVAALRARLGAQAILAAQLRPPVYRVQPGDTLSGIAARYHIDMWALARFNGMPVGAMLRIGELLRLPGASRPPAQVVAQAMSASTSPGARTATLYRVRPGDTLTAIAARYGISPAALAQRNGIGLNALLQVGEPLRLSAVVPLHAPEPSGPAVSGALAGVYRVRPGDTLSAIAAHYGIGARTLAQRNGIALNALLQVGERLRLPGRAPSAAVRAANATADHALPPAIAAPVAAMNAMAVAQTVTHAAPPAAAADPQPVSARQAKAIGPMLGPEADPARSVDPANYRVAANGTIRVAPAESLGYYAQWLGVSAMDLRRLNHLALHQPVRIGERIRLDFHSVTPQEFTARRLAYHQALEQSYFAHYRIDGTRKYVTRSGDSLWTLTRRFSDLPAWLLRQYNPHTDFFTLHPGTSLVIPRIEPAGAAG
ncbi:MAG: LysM peptidoglycan-binding domain-containing protein [Pseudomonadota bacterium]|jgi:membrane-bound lytic murein transglycosylase D|nr:LysM peptidoglycan-binding domain-containing protein [Pseudomonadota bacterium]